LASGIAGKSRSTNPDVPTAGSIVMKRIETHGGIGDAGGEAEQSVIALSGAGPGIAAVRRRNDCLRVLDERKADEGKCNQNCWNACFHIPGFSEKSRQLVEAIRRKRESPKPSLQL
jgi:hypothetical protein